VQGAARVLESTNDKPLHGRKIAVSFTHQALLDLAYGASLFASSGQRHKRRKVLADSGKPTSLSMLKTGMSGRANGYVFFIYSILYSILFSCPFALIHY
jgi:hypothetical protein